MTNVLKIAAGVTIGILVAFAVMKAPAYLAEQREESATDFLRAVTPDKLHSKCGESLTDVTVAVIAGLDERTISYKDHIGGEWRFTFLGDHQKNDYRFASLKSRFTDAADWTSLEKVNFFPCLSQ